jgi:hypothetical protein
MGCALAWLKLMPAPDTIDLTNKAVRHCWLALVSLLSETRWRTREELLRGLDDLVLA